MVVDKVPRKTVGEPSLCCRFSKMPFVCILQHPGCERAQTQAEVDARTHLDRRRLRLQMYCPCSRRPVISIKSKQKEGKSELKHITGEKNEGSAF